MKPADIEANRQRYAALRAAGQGSTAAALPPLTARGTVPVPETSLIHQEVLPGDWYWATRLRQGEALRLHNTSGAASAALVAWNCADTSERINFADTVKVQWTAALRKGRVILSDMGRVMLAIVEDTSGAHDALAGGSTRANAAPGTRNTRDNFIAAAAKLGLERRDVPPCLTFFAPVRTDRDGRLVWDEAQRSPGDFVDLRAEMDLWVVVSACRHPLDPHKDMAAGNVDITRFRAPSRADDICRTVSPEAARAFDATDRYLQ